MQNVIITIERAPNGQDVVKISAIYPGAAAFDPGNTAHQMAAFLMQAAANMPGIQALTVANDASTLCETLLITKAA